MTRVLRILAAGSTAQLIGGDPTEAARVFGVDGVAVSLKAESTSGELVWSSPGRSERLEDIQFTLGEGPGIEALAFRSLILEPDLELVSASRWPALLPAAAELGVRAVFCFPLRIGGACLGVLTAQRAVPGPLPPQALDDALLLAAALTAVVLDAGQARNLVAADHVALLHRAVVHQATGMISVQAGVPVAQALLLLRAYAYRHERPLVEVANDVVARRLGFRDDHSGPDPSADPRG